MQVQRWSRYGHERLYVKTDDGVQVGWVDLKTGRRTVERLDLADAFHEVVAQYLVVPSVPSVPVQRDAEVPCYDLAWNRPGSGVRAQATALREEMRAKSKVGTFLARLFDAKTDERAMRKGAEGEEAVGPRLERLREHGWTVLHVIPIHGGKYDVDHLLIGPGGVFSINTKNHPGGNVWVGERAIMVNGQHTDYLRKCGWEAKYVSKALHAATGLQVPVVPALVFTNSALTVRQRPENVVILRLRDVPSVFHKRSARLNPETISVLYGAARRSITWP